MAINNSVRSESQSIMGGSGNLNPIEQTIFERGPQATFTPPEVANVYQEGQTIFAQQPIAVEAANIDWYTLGANASQLAAQTYENVLDYLITSKRNGVVNLKDKIQSELDEYYLQQSNEMYNADKQKRPPNTKVIEDLTQKIKTTRQRFKDEAIDILGSNGYFDPKLDITKLGLKYQELAMTATGSMRDIDRFANRLLYETQRVSNGITKQENNWAAWKNGAGVRDPKIQPGVLAGTLPLPPHPEDPTKPIIGFKKTMSGELVPLGVTDPMTGQLKYAVRQDTDGNWFFNVENIDALDSVEQFQDLFNLDNFAYGSESAVMNATGELTVDVERMTKDVLESEAPNIGMAAYVATAFANLPDHLAENAIDRIDGLDADQKVKLSLMRLHVKNRFSPSELAKITGLKREALKETSDRLQKLRTGTTIYNVARNQQEREKYAELIGVANAILTEFEVPLEIDELQIEGENLTDLSPEVSAQSLLSTNPQLVPMIARIVGTLESNPELYRNNPEQRTKDIQTLIREQIRREGYLVMPNEATGIPNIIFSPNLSYLGELRETLKTNIRLAGLSDEKQEQLKTDPRQQYRALAYSHVFSDNWSTNIGGDNLTDIARTAALQLSPKLDTEVFDSLIESAVFTKKDDRGARIRTQLPFVELLRLTVAATPTAMEKKGLSPAVQDFDSRLLKAREIYNDLPIADKDKGATPWLNLDIDMSQQNWSFIGTPRGGLPIKINELKGMSGIDYKEVMTTAGSRQLGAITPRAVDGTPLIFIPSHTDKSGDVKAALNKGMETYLEAERGTALVSPVSFDVESMPSTIAPLPSEVFAQVLKPYIPTRAAILTTVDGPLESFETALAFFTQNNNAFYDIVRSDPTLTSNQKLAWEVAIDPDGTEVYDKNKVLFTDENLRILYDKAVKNGAKTHTEFMGYIFEAMRVYGENKEIVQGRDTGLEFVTKSGPEDFLGKEGNKKGVVLFNASSPLFLSGVYDRLTQGYNLYVKNNQYYMFTPAEAPANFKLLIDSTKPEQVMESEFARFKAKRDRADKARKLFFTGKNVPTPESIVELARPTTISQQQLQGFQRDFSRYAFENDLQNFVDFRFIDWPAIYAKHGKIPFNPTEVPEEYFLPGHSSSLSKRGKVAIEQLRTSADFTGIATDQYKKEIEKYVSTDGYLPHQVLLNLHAHTVGYATGIAYGAVDSTKTEEDIYRMEGIKQEPMKWFDNIFGNNDTALLRRTQLPNQNNIKIAEKAFNLVNFVKTSKYDYDTKIAGGLSQESWSKIRESNLTPIELEYQLRVRAANLKGNTTDIAKLNQVIPTVSNDEFVLDANKTIEFANAIYYASLKANKPITKEEAKTISLSSNSMVEAKRKFFTLTFKPNGYMSRANKTPFESKVDLVYDYLK